MPVFFVRAVRDLNPEKRFGIKRKADFRMPVGLPMSVDSRELVKTSEGQSKRVPVRKMVSEISEAL